MSVTQTYTIKDGIYVVEYAFSSYLCIMTQVLCNDKCSVTYSNDILAIIYWAQPYISTDTTSITDIQPVNPPFTYDSLLPVKDRLEKLGLETVKVICFSDRTQGRLTTGSHFTPAGNNTQLKVLLTVWLECISRPGCSPPPPSNFFCDAEMLGECTVRSIPPCCVHTIFFASTQNYCYQICIKLHKAEELHKCVLPHGASECAHAEK